MKEGKAGLGVWIGLNATVFLAAACIMTVEILSTRLVARYLGASLYTWTSAIGVVLAGISVGNYLGGRLADRYEPRRMLSYLFIASSLGCMTIPVMNSWLGQWSLLTEFSWPVRILVHFLLTFLVPATLLGTMSPVVAKMALAMSVVGPGRTVGTIYAWGSAGSIFGTFAAGFWLVSEMGTEGSIFVVAGVLAFAGIVYGHKKLLPLVWGGGYGALLLFVLGPWSWNQAVAETLGLRDPLDDSLLFKRDSHYQRVMVYDRGKGRRDMLLDTLTHSKVDLGDPLLLKYEYEAIYAEVMRAIDPSTAPVSALFIGGGGCVFPRYLEITRPGSHLEVAEIDPVVTEAAFEAFGLPRQTQIQFHDLDGRNHVDDLLRRKRAGEAVPDFDFIFGDAFNDFTVPFHLVTLEYAERLAELLGEHGVYMLNLIEVLDSSRLLGPVLTTLDAVFPHVYLFGANAQTSDRNTFVVVASPAKVDVSGVRDAVFARHGVRTLPLEEKHLAVAKQRGKGFVLTDDYAPVENLLKDVIRSGTSGGSMQASLAQRLAALLETGREEEALRVCRERLQADGATPLLHHWAGIALARLGRFEEALVSFREETAAHSGVSEAHLSAARVLGLLQQNEEALREVRKALEIRPTDAEARLLLVELLLEAGREGEARAELTELLELRPGHIRARLVLASVLGEETNLAAAAEIYEEALQLDPDDPEILHDYGLALLHSGRGAEAAASFEGALALEPLKPSLHNQLGRAHAMSGQSERAIEAFRQAVALDPENASYRANLGLALEESARRDEAIIEYRACLARDASNVLVMNALALLLASGPEPDPQARAEAVRLAEAVCEAMGESHPEALFTLARAHAGARHEQKAKTIGQRARLFAQRHGTLELLAEIDAFLRDR